MQALSLQAFLKLLNHSIALIFLVLVGLWLGIKLEVVQNLYTGADFFTYIDVVRSQLSLDLALLLIFFVNAYNKTSRLASGSNALLFFISTFYFLKLTGLYAYTYDSTPWGMITYGSFLLQIPFSGEWLSTLVYITLPALLLLYLCFETSKSKKLRWPAVSVSLLVLLACVPPIQQQIPSSIAYHPYIYSVSGVFNSQNKLHAEITNPANQIAHKEITTPALPLKKNIVIIVLESFAYSGISLQSTPVLYALRENSLNFEHAYAPIPHTSKALVNIFCTEGAFFSPYLWESLYGVSKACMPKKFNANSVFFQGITDSFENRRALIKALGFEKLYALEDMNTQGFEAVNYFSYEDKIILPASHQWLEENAQSPFIAAYLTGTTHHNYQTPSHFASLELHSNKKINRYLNAQRYVDSFVSDLLNQYQQLGLYENTLFIFVGDHGEGFDKQRPLMHNNNLFQTGIHIPLFIFNAQAPVTRKESGLITQNDISQLISWLQGDAPFPSNTATTHSCWYMDYCYAYLIYHQGSLFKYLWDKRNHKTLLFNLDSDPNEHTNIADSHSELVAQLHAQLEQAVSENITRHHLYYLEKDSDYIENRAHTFSNFKAVKY